jgi:hypothetical protein
MRLEGSCRCGAISFSVDSHTPYPYQRCYCSICRKSAGGGGYAINIMGLADTLKVKGKSTLGVWNAPIDRRIGSADRHYCKHCGTPLWVSDEQWPELVHPFASAIDTELPKAPSSVHLLQRDKASWVEPQIGPNDCARLALVEKPVITAPIVGATKLHHLDDAIAAINVKLSAEEIAALEPVISLSRVSRCSSKPRGVDHRRLLASACQRARRSRVACTRFGTSSPISGLSAKAGSRLSYLHLEATRLGSTTSCQRPLVGACSS